MVKLFFDSNVIIYGNDNRDAAKQARALDRIKQAINDRTGVISTQVLSEYAAVCLHTLHHDRMALLKQLILLESMQIVQVTPALVRRALEIHALYNVRLYDGQIIAAAELARCDVLLSEDLNTGQLYAGVRVENPFA